MAVDAAASNRADRVSAAVGHASLTFRQDHSMGASQFQAGLRAVCGRVNLEIVKRSDLHKFVVLPKRWIVERTIGWLNRCRRLAKDWECLNRSALAFLRWSSVRLMLRRLCQTSQ